MSVDYDVVVVGGGGAGLCAALSAAQNGAEVLLLEAAPKLGGSAALSGGAFYAAGTPIQKAAGVNDTADAMYHYYMIVNQYRLEPSLVRRLCDESADVMEWLQDLGVEFHKDVYVAGLANVARGHRGIGGGAGIIEVLDRRVYAHPGITIALNSRVGSLTIDRDQIVGVEADGHAVTAGAVVLTTGGFGANPAMIAERYPHIASYGDWNWYTGSEYCRGDGLLMAEAAGATTVGQKTAMTLLTPGFGRDLEPWLPGWFLLVDHAGRRFMDEAIDYCVGPDIVRDLPQGECFAIFDEQALQGDVIRQLKAGTTWEAPSYTPDRLTEMAEMGKVARADSIEALAAILEKDADALRVTVSQYNRCCAQKSDDLFFKKSELLRPIEEAPYFGIRIRPAIIAYTGEGIRTDADARALGSTGRALPGLFAAGETVGGVLGSCYVGSGGALLNSFTFGRRAGMAAAAYSKRNISQEFAMEDSQ